MEPTILLDDKNEKSLVPTNNLPQSSIAGIDVNALLSKAIDHNTPVETMEKLLAMARQLKADYALEQFNISLAEFQAECPEIEKTKLVRDKDGKVRYKFAPLQDIVKQVKDLLLKYGFSYTIKTNQTDTKFKAICEVRHINGHSEKTAFVIPIDAKAYMGPAQKVGAASTYAKRYAFCNAFGIMTGDEDTDANNIDPEPAQQKPQYTKPKEQTTYKPTGNIYGDIMQLISSEKMTAQNKIQYKKSADELKHDKDKLIALKEQIESELKISEVFK